MIQITYAVEPGFIVKAPEQKTAGAAGYDLHIPQFTDEFINAFAKMNKKILEQDVPPADKVSYIDKNKVYLAGNSIILPPHSRAIVPSGLRFNIPNRYMLEGANRGSVSSLQGIIHGAHIIDCDYFGMVFMSIINTGVVAKELKEGASLLQVLVREVPPSTLIEVPINDLYKDREQTARGEGALGSTNS